MIIVYHIFGKSQAFFCKKVAQNGGMVFVRFDQREKMRASFIISYTWHIVNMGKCTNRDLKFFTFLSILRIEKLVEGMI